MRALLPATTVAFALTSTVRGVLFKPVNATADAQIHLYPFVTSDCTGQPFTSPYEMKQGQCVNMNQARSLRPRFRFDHADWVKEVNNLHMNCKLETFSDFGCPENNKIEEYQHGLSGDLPKRLNSCLIPQQQKNQGGGSSNSFFSARFVCGKLENPDHLCTSIIKHTTWSIDSTYGEPHYDVNTATYTGSLFIPVQASATIEKRFKPGRETKGVWMHHPWSQSLLCYLCYPKKEHDYRKVECRAGADFPANCGPEPVFDSDGKTTKPVSTTTTTTTKVTTTHRTTTTTERVKKPHPHYLDVSSSDSEWDEDLSYLDIELQQKKSWHTPVKFQHPFVEGKEACADAEWEKRGQMGRDYIKIQKVHFCDDKDREDSQWIGLPETADHTVHKTTSTTSSIVHTSTSTRVRHDQL